MTYAPLIFCLDLATNSGWAEGRVGEQPRYGAVRFAPPGSSPDDVFGGALRWLSERLKAFPPDMIVYEAPLPATFVAGKSNVNTAAILTGLPAILRGVARLRGLRDVSQVNVQQVRRHFIGKGRLPRDEAKRAVITRCNQLGWQPYDDNAADALAIWDYTAARISPRYGADRAMMGFDRLKVGAP